MQRKRLIEIIGIKGNKTEEDDKTRQNRIKMLHQIGGIVSSLINLVEATVVF